MSTRRLPLYYGWVMTITLSLTVMVAWGVTYYAFGVMLTPMQRELGWSSAELTGAFSLSLLMAAFGEALVGRVLDARGPRLPAALGSAFVALLLLAWAMVRTLPVFYAIMIAMGLVGPSIQYGPGFWVAARWFKRRRGAALTMITVVGGLASTVFIPLITAWEQAHGWRATLWLLAGIAALLVVPQLLLLRRLPADLGLQVDGDAEPPGLDPVVVVAPVSAAGLRAALARPAFWLLALSFGLANLAFNGVTVHLLAYELSRGQSAALAAAAAGLAGIVQGVGRLLVGPLSQRLPRRTVIAILFVAQALAYGALPALPLNSGLLIHVILRSLGAGPLSLMRAGLVAEMFGTERYGTIMGAMAFVINIAGALSPVAIGLFVGVGGYTPVLWAFVATSLIGALAMSQVGRVRG